MMLSRLTSDTFILIWNVACIVTFLLPFMSFVLGRLTTNDQNNDNNNDNNNNNENNYGNNYNNPDCYDEYGYYYGPTHWWQFWKTCSNNNGQDDNDNDNDEMQSPWWYIWGEREGQGNPEEEGKGALLFVYIWTLVIFAGLAYLGNTTGMAVNKLESMRWILLGFANYCFVIIVLLIALEGVESEGREMEETGFYGQTAVLLLMTCIFAMIQSIVFVSWTTKRLKHLKVMEEQQSSSNTEKSDEYVAVEYDNSPPAPPGYKITF